MKVAALYMQKLLDQASDPFLMDDNQNFKLAHAEGACAVFRDLGMLTGEENATWCNKFRENCKAQLKAARLRPFATRGDAILYLKGRAEAFRIHGPASYTNSGMSAEDIGWCTYNEKFDRIEEARISIRFFAEHGFLTRQETLKWRATFDELEQELGNYDSRYPMPQIVIIKKPATDATLSGQ